MREFDGLLTVIYGVFAGFLFALAVFGVIEGNALVAFLDGVLGTVWLFLSLKFAGWLR